MKLYRGNKEIVDLVIDGSTTITNKLMMSNTLDFSVSTTAPVDFRIGDYVLSGAERYELFSLPDVTVADGKYEYSGQFSGYIHTLDNWIIEDTEKEAYYFTGTLNEHLDFILKAIETKDAGWSIIKPTAGDVEILVKQINYLSDSCLGALYKAASEYNVEFDVVQKCITFSRKIERATQLSFEVGKGLGLYKITRGKVSGQNVVTRLIGLGGATNMQFAKHLALPEKYLEQNVEMYGIREQKITFDWIFPRRNSKITSNATLVQGSTELWQVTDSSMDFNLWDMVAEDPKIVFTTGACAGYGFVITRYDNATKTITFKQHVINDGENVTVTPRTLCYPAAGDSYHYINILMPESYTTNAIVELREQTRQELAKMCMPQHPYTVEIDPRFIKSTGVKPTNGDTVRIINQAIGLDADIRVISVSYPVVDGNKIEIVINDDILSSSSSALSRSVNKITEFVSQNKIELGNKLDTHTWNREFEVMPDALMHKRTALFKSLVVFDEYSEGGGGGGADLPVGVLGDVLYHDGASWVAKQASTLGFATQQWVEAQSYATQTWVAQQGYATQTWVTNKGYLTGITKAQVLGVMSGSGSASQYLAGNGTFYTVGYGELSGKPDLSVYALKTKVITLDGNVSTNRANNMGNETWFDYSFGGSGIAGSAISFAPIGGYATQISASYFGNEFAFRTYNGDSRVWTAVRRVWHDGNAGTSANDWNSRNMNVHGTLVCHGQVVFATY